MSSITIQLYGAAGNDKKRSWRCSGNWAGLVILALDEWMFACWSPRVNLAWKCSNACNQRLSVRHLSKRRLSIWHCYTALKEASARTLWAAGIRMLVYPLCLFG